MKWKFTASTTASAVVAFLCILCNSSTAFPFPIPEGGEDGQHQLPQDILPTQQDSDAPKTKRGYRLIKPKYKRNPCNSHTAKKPCEKDGGGLCDWVNNACVLSASGGEETMEMAVPEPPAETEILRGKGVSLDIKSMEQAEIALADVADTAREDVQADVQAEDIMPTILPPAKVQVHVQADAPADLEKDTLANMPEATLGSTSKAGKMSKASKASKASKSSKASKMSKASKKSNKISKAMAKSAKKGTSQPPPMIVQTAPSLPTRAPMFINDQGPVLPTSSTSPSTDKPSTSTIATLDIELTDASLPNGGGLPNTPYSFVLKAENIPDGISEIRFEWTPGFGAGGIVAATAKDGQASTMIEVSYPTPGLFDVTATLYDGQNKLATDSLQVEIAGTTLSIDPPGKNDAIISTTYTFTFVADDIPASVDNVIFKWSFGVGQSGVGNSGSVAVASGQATASASQAYTSNGAFGLVVDVRDADTDSVLAESSATVFVGATNQRDDTLTFCGSWSAAQSGGEGVTIDNWDISMIPEGAVFDIKFDAYSIPDKFIVEYPLGNIVLDTGWRGSNDYDGNALYPGGITGDGGNEVNNVFSRLSEDTLLVTAIGPDPGTGWEYDIRCRTPTLADGDVCSDANECPSMGCGFAKVSPVGTNSDTVCCASGAVRVSTYTPSSYIIYRNFCKDQPRGSLCLENDEICASDACVNGTCATSKLASGEICSTNNDCFNGACGLNSFSTNASLVCCASGATRVYTYTSDGWPSTTSRYFCTDQPDNTACGVTDAICATNACIGGNCTSVKLADNSVCGSSNHCQSGACGYESFNANASNVCCASSKTSPAWTTPWDGDWPSSKYRDFCTNQPLNTACGENDFICASDACVNGTCASSKLASDEICTINNDCLNGYCGLDSFSANASLVCCASGATRVYTPWGDYRYFCTDQPDNTACGVTDGICASDACIGGNCTSVKLADNSVCGSSSHCLSEACGHDSSSADSSLLCCASGETTYAYIAGMGRRYFCTDQPVGTTCGVNDDICESDACVNGTCATSKLASGEICTVSNDCLNGACGLDSFSANASLVCCASVETAYAYAAGMPGRYFCTDQPDNTACGVTDAICATNACIGGNCSSKLNANSVCTASSHCQSGACGLESFSTNASLVCCASGESTCRYTYTSSSEYRCFCTDQPVGTACGELDEICNDSPSWQQDLASKICVGGSCVEKSISEPALSRSASP